MAAYPQASRCAQGGFVCCHIHKMRVSPACVIGLQDNAKVSVFPVVEHTICHHRIQKLFPQNVILGGYPSWPISPYSVNT